MTRKLFLTLLAFFLLLLSAVGVQGQTPLFTDICVDICVSFCNAEGGQNCQEDCEQQCAGTNPPPETNPSASCSNGRCPLQVGEVCGEEYVLETQSSTASVTTIINRDDGDTSCGNIHNGRQGYEVQSNPDHDLPFIASCSRYEVRITDRSHDDWLALNTYTLNRRDRNKVYYRWVDHGGMFTDDNEFEAAVVLNSENKVEKIQIKVIDGTRNSGGVAWALYCIDPQFDPQNNAEQCRTMHGDNAWNQQVYEQGQGRGCCGAGGPADYGKKYDVSGEEIFCTQSGWSRSSECSLSFVEETGISITDLSPGACLGEVLRDESNVERLAGLSWMRATGNCGTIRGIGNSEYLDVGASQAGGSGPSCIDNDGDGYGESCDRGSDCDDGNEFIHSMRTCKNPATCEEYQACVLSCPQLSEETWNDGTCSDRMDNNCDGLVDHADPTCDPGEGEDLAAETFSVDGLSAVTGFATHDTTDGDTSQPGTCDCAQGDVWGTGSCNAGYLPICTSSSSCECRTTTPPDGGAGETEPSPAEETIDYPFWAECSAGSFQNSLDQDRLGGYNYAPGTDVVSCNNIPHYCAFNSAEERVEWVVDLDKREYQVACNAYNFTGTGNYCCGEPEDGEESYNDPNSDRGACLDGEFQRNRELVSDNILVERGVFYGCGGTIEQADAHSGDPLVEEVSSCTLKGEYYCSSSANKWVLQSEKLDGDTICTKTNIDDTEKGFCPFEEQCFYGSSSPHPDGCVDPGFTEGDKYCQQGGTWTTRTRFVAEKLVNLAGNNDFRLLCDEKAKSLLKPENSGGVGKFCALLLEGEVVLGAAVSDIDIFLSDFTIEYNRAYGEEEITHACNEGVQNFGLCLEADSMKVYYDSQKELVLLTPTMNVQGSFVQRILNFFRNLFGVAPDEVTIEDFDKLFIDKKGAREIRAVYEYILTAEGRQAVMTAEYSGVNSGRIPGRIPGQVTVNNNIVVVEQPGAKAWDMVTASRLN